MRFWEAVEARADWAAVARAGRSPTFLLLVSLRDEFANRLIRLSQRRFIGQKHNAKMSGGSLLTKAGSMDNKHMLGPAQFLYENVVALLDVNARKGVERPPGRNATQA